MIDDISARKLAAAFWHFMYPRSNFYGKDMATQRQWVEFADQQINHFLLLQNSFFYAGFEEGFKAGTAKISQEENDVIS
jgi:hypothetical protein